MRPVWLQNMVMVLEEVADHDASVLCGLNLFGRIGGQWLDRTHLADAPEDQAHLVEALTYFERFLDFSALDPTAHPNLADAITFQKRGRQLLRSLGAV